MSKRFTRGKIGQSGRVNELARVVVDGCTPSDVADELGVSVNSVYLAKSRVMRRLREELGDLFD